MYFYQVFVTTSIRGLIAAERQRGSSLILTFQFRMRSVNLVPLFRPSYILSKSRFVCGFVEMTDFRGFFLLGLRKTIWPFGYFLASFYFQEQILILLVNCNTKCKLYMRNGVESRNGSRNGTLYVNYLLVQPITTWMSK